jgi:hypothetical protein
MICRYALFSMMIMALLAPLAASRPQAPYPPLSPALSNPKVATLPDGVTPVYRPINGTKFGNQCRICPDDILQGQIDDCYLLSSLATIATVNPGTFQNAIQTMPDGSYLVTLYPDGQKKEIRVDTTFPAMPGPWPVWNLLSDPYLSSDYVKTLARSLVLPKQYDFVYAQPPSGGSMIAKLKGSNGALWPMIVEKAYADRLAGGYGGYKGGGQSYRAMKTITGQPGGGYIISPPGPATSPDVVKSVFIQDSPAVADRGGHSIIGGLLRFDLQAIQPNLKICASVLGSNQHPNCTQICHESHSCRQLFTGGGVPLAQGQKLHVVVTDVDQPGSEHKIAEFDQDAPASCVEGTPDKPGMPCTFQAPATDWVIPGPLVFSFVVRKSANPQLGEGVKGVLTTVAEIDAVFTQLQNDHRAVTAGTAATCAGRTLVCDQAFESGKLERTQPTSGHDYFLKSYDHASETVLLGNPHGSQVSIPLAEFLQAFYQITYNEVEMNPSPCGCN